MIIQIRERVNGYRVPPCDTTSVGDWQGEEEQAARQFVALCEAVAEALPARLQSNESDDPFFNGLRGEQRQDEFEALCDELWNAWGADERLLTLTAEQMVAEAAHRVGLRAAGGVPAKRPVPPNQ